MPGHYWLELRINREATPQNVPNFGASIDGGPGNYLNIQSYSLFLLSGKDRFL